MQPRADAALLAAEPTRFRVTLNRFLFRAMLFVSGAIAIAMYRVSKPLTWRFAKLQARNLMRLCGVRVRTRGLEQLGPGPYIFAPNHQSHFDIAALLGLLPGVTRFAAKREMFDEPILGAVLRTMGMIPVDRDDPMSTIDRLRQVTLDGGSLVIFPEGTRSRDGQLLPFKKGPFVAAIGLGVQIVPVVCKGTTRIMPKGKYLSILPGEAELIVLEPIDAAQWAYEDRAKLRDLVRERIAAELATDSPL
jgi:1-acyl-sn-glycerol-3-phosphate acyltransferase